MKHRFPPRLIAIALAALPCAPLANAQTAASNLADLSLEDLMKVELTSASKKAQRLSDTPAAAFVISADDIRRSGVTSIPEALRMAPGVEVAKIAGNKWAISARGFNSRFANKLLVLVDGRSVYSPLYSGVVWEDQDTLLEDVERIEVVRGPGASLWGANAVNGVINIITKKAADTQGAMLVGLAGDKEHANVAARFGGKVGEDGHFRVYAKGFDIASNTEPGGRSANDTRRGGSIGFRYDREPDRTSRFTLTGNATDSRNGDTWLVPSLAVQGPVRSDFKQGNGGFNLTGRYERKHGDGTGWSVQSYFDSTRITTGGALAESRDTFDIEFQQRTLFGGGHDVVWGTGFRNTRDRIDTNGIISVSPARRSTSLFSAFVQDEITLLPNQLKLTLGSRFERNDLSGWSNQPTGRLTWNVSPTQTLWTSLSRAVRTPSRAELDTSFALSVTPAAPPFVPFPVLSQVFGSGPGHLSAEKVTAFEAGFRTQLTQVLSLDVTGFYSRNRDLRGGLSGTPFFTLSPLPPHIIAPVATENAANSDVSGLEVAVDWRVSKTWRLLPSYTYMRMTAPVYADAARAGLVSQLLGSDPRHQLSLRSQFDLGSNREFDLWLRSVSALPVQQVKAYTVLDLRYAWRPMKGLELSLVAQNLGRKRHAEFVSDNLNSVPIEIDRSFYLKGKWNF